MSTFIFRLERLFQLRAKDERHRAQDLARAVRDEQEREPLHEKKREAWVTERARSEQKEMDALSGQRHARKDAKP